MITTASKLWFAVAALSLVAAVIYVLASGGEWFGGFVLGTLAIAAAGIGVLAVAVRDGDVDADGVSDPAVAVVPVRRTLPSGWPALAAVGAGTVAVGLAGGNALRYVGLGILAVVLVEWMVQAWAERATGDHAANQTLRNRVMYPLEIPALAAIGVAIVVLSFSRVMLALPKAGSTIVAIVLASAVLGVAALLTTRPRLSSSVLAGIVAVGAVALVAGGVVSAVVGEREFEHHGEEHLENPGSDEANNPVADVGGENQSDPGADPPVANLDDEPDPEGEPTPDEPDAGDEE